MRGIDRPGDTTSRLDLLREIQMDTLEEVWPNGRNPAAPWDGPHYTLRGFRRPVSISPVESYFIANLTKLSAPSIVFEIGTGFGYSAAWFALGIADTQSSGSVLTIDNYSEGGLGSAGADAARVIADRMNLTSIIYFLCGNSPEDVPGALGERMVDIAFIDADHHGHHPVSDYSVIAPRTRDNGIILFHDADKERYTVHAAIEQAFMDGWSISELGTSCHLTVAYRDKEWEPVVGTSLHAARLRRMVT